MNWKIWFDRKEIGERAPLLVRKLAAKAGRVENGLALRLRHLAKIAEGAGNEAATIFRESAKLLHRAANLLSLRRRKALHGFGAVKDSAALVRRHVIELRQAIAHALLGRRGQIAKAGLIFQSALLLRERKVAVTVHPLGQMLLIPVRLWSERGP